jgi:cytochrome c5
LTWPDDGNESITVKQEVLMKKVLVTSCCLLFIVALLPATTIATEEEGAALLEERCSVCHPSARPKSKTKTPEQWERTVTRMMGKGAKLSDEEKETLVDYLSKTYKP